MTGIARSGVISPDDIIALGYHPSLSPLSSTTGSPAGLTFAPAFEHFSLPTTDSDRSGHSTPLQALAPPYSLRYHHSQKEFASSMLAQGPNHQQPQYQQTLVTNYVVNGKPGVHDPRTRRTKRSGHSQTLSTEGLANTDSFPVSRHQTAYHVNSAYSKTIYSGAQSAKPSTYIVPTTPVHEHQGWEMMTPIHVNGEIQLPTPPMTNEDNTLTPKPSSQALHARPSVASISSHISVATTSAASSASMQSKPRTPRKRGLKIKRSDNEGRRLVFPEALSSPETSTKDLTSEAEDDVPSTPRKKRSPRVVPVSGLTQTPMGTVSFGTRDVLASDLSWLEPGMFEDPPRVAEDEDLERAGIIRRGPLPTGVSHSASRFEGLSKAERKRKRLQAFRNVSMDAGYSRENMLTTLKGIGRVACGQELATKFLVPTGTSVSVESQQNSTISMAPSDSGRAINPLQPAWPDSHFPWSSADFNRKQQVDNSKRMERVRRLALVEKYLEQMSDDEGDDFDPRAALRNYMMYGPASNPSDAREAIFQVKKDGKSLISTETFQLPPGIPIASYDDETGCVCRGSNEEGGAMVCCDNCGVWHHMMCVGIETEEDLGEQWFCWDCARKNDSALRETTPQHGEHRGSLISVPMQPTFSANEDATRGYHAHSSDTALAPSPIFSTSGKFLVPDTPGFYLNTPRVPSNSTSYTPRAPSSSSMVAKFATPATPSSRARTVSYAEHYNVCQTPGATDLDYTKVYATPKFEDLFETGFTPLRASPTPGGSAGSEARDSYGEFRTPTTTQSFFKGLHSGGSQPTPGLEHLSSAISNHSSYPVSPVNFPPKLNPAISELTTSPSPLRSHRRQVSFGNRVASQSYSASHLRESVIIEERSTGDSTPDRNPAKPLEQNSGGQSRQEEIQFGDEL